MRKPEEAQSTTGRGSEVAQPKNFCFRSVIVCWRGCTLLMSSARHAMTKIVPIVSGSLNIFLRIEKSRSMGEANEAAVCFLLCNDLVKRRA